MSAENHSDPSLSPPPACSEADDLLRLLERLESDRLGQPLGAEALKEALDAAGRSLDSAAEGPPRAWAWLVAAGERAGLQVTRLSATWDEAQEHLQRGPVVALASSGWQLLLSAGPAGGARVYQSSSEEERSLSASELVALLGGESPGATFQFAFVQEHLPSATASSTGSAERLSPAARLFQIAAPESRDIKTLVVFSIFVGLLNLAAPVTVEALVNTVAFVGLVQPIVVLALVLALCLGLAGALAALEAVVVELIQRRVFVRVATDLAYRLPRVRAEALDSAYGPELVNRFLDVATVQKAGSKLLLDGVAAILSALIGLLVLAFYHPLLLAFDLVLLSALAAIVFGLGRGAVKTALKESSAKYAVVDWLEELVRHPLAFQLARGRDVAVRHMDTLAKDYLGRRGEHYRVVLRQLVGAIGLQVVCSTLLLGLGGWLVKLGQLTLGQLVASWLIVSLVLGAVAKLGRSLESVYDLLAASDKLGVLFDLELEEEGGEFALSSAGPAALALSGVGYTWPRGARLFSQLGLSLAAGERLAIVGPNGSGKSTLLELIQGQRRSQVGRVELEGQDLRSLRLASVRARIGLARAGEVIAGSVIENVRFGADLDPEEIRLALTDLGLWEAVQALPDGLETQLASFGSPLSTGQADLLVLARLICARPGLLLVDGLLDGLDEATLARVSERLARDPSWTLVVATGRMEVARRFATQLRLERGALIPLNPEEARS